ncbi:hypothetical protein [Kitasatospora sp. NPDC001225]
MTAEQTGLRIQQALDALADSGADAERAGEQLVRDLMEFYGQGLARLVPALPPPALDRMLDDPVVAGLLLLHDLHPEDLPARIERALAALPERSRRPASTRPPASCGCAARPPAAAAASRRRRPSWPATRPR